MAVAPIPSPLRSVIATDCGSTTTKAILIERNAAGEYRLTARGEAPTTVEAPVEDVTRGVLNAVREIEELRGRRFLSTPHNTADTRIVSPQRAAQRNGETDTTASGTAATDTAAPDEGTDIYISTSSAGGGLQMMVAGVVQKMTTESATRAALGAGAIVMDALSANDKRAPHEKIERIRQLRPDMILLAGGTDGGTIKHVVATAELLRAAQPRPRLGHAFNLPVIYAGNKAAQPEVTAILADKVALQLVDNVRPGITPVNRWPGCPGPIRPAAARAA